MANIDTARRKFEARPGVAALLRSEAHGVEYPRASFWDDDERAEPTVERYGEAAIVRVCGPLSHHDEYWFDSYDAIVKRVDAALMSSPRPRVIALVLDTPGGDASGCFETAAAIRKRCETARIPLVAYVEGMACSAGYALACAASKIVASPASVVGSIGVIGGIVDMTAAAAMSGVKIRIIKSGSRKSDGHPFEPTTREAEDATQVLIDGLADLFFAHVATSRPGLSVDALRSFEAGVFLGAGALGARLVDAVGTLDTAIASATAPTTVAPAKSPTAPPMNRGSVAAVGRASRTEKSNMATKPKTETSTEESAPSAVMEEADLAALRTTMEMPDASAQEVVDAAVARLNEDATEPGEPAPEGDGESASAKAMAGLAATNATLRDQLSALSARVATLEPFAAAHAEREREAKVDAAMAKHGVHASHRSRFLDLAKKHGAEVAIDSIAASHITPPMGTVGGAPPESSTGAKDPVSAAPSGDAKNDAVRAEFARIQREDPSKPPQKVQREAMDAARAKNPSLFAA